jgi:hypothetical protein
MKEENDLDVRKISQTQEAVRGKSRRVEIDPASNAAPNIVQGLYNRAADHPDRTQLDLLHHGRIVIAEHVLQPSDPQGPISSCSPSAAMAALLWLVTSLPRPVEAGDQILRPDFMCTGAVDRRRCEGAALAHPVSLDRID